MTNGFDIPLVPCCPENGGGNLLPLMVVVVVLIAGHVIFQEFKKRKGKPEMKNFKNLAIVAGIVVAVGIVFALKPRATVPGEPGPASTAEAAGPLPRLLELGADTCIPCKQMAPIIEELKTAYAGQLRVDFIDVHKNEGASEVYDVRLIPLQIFFDAEGQELFRHEGFFAKDDILAKWKELGVDLQPTEAP